MTYSDSKKRNKKVYAIGYSFSSTWYSTHTYLRCLCIYVETQCFGYLHICQFAYHLIGLFAMIHAYAL